MTTCSRPSHSSHTRKRAAAVHHQYQVRLWRHNSGGGELCHKASGLNAGSMAVPCAQEPASCGAATAAVIAGQQYQPATHTYVHRCHPAFVTTFVHSCHYHMLSSLHCHAIMCCANAQHCIHVPCLQPEPAVPSAARVRLRLASPAPPAATSWCVTHSTTTRSALTPGTSALAHTSATHCAGE